MTAEIQWEEDWFSVSDVRNEIQDELEEAEQEAIQGSVEAMKESVESIKEWIEKDIREEEREKEQEKSAKQVNPRVDGLEQLVRHQHDIIRGLGEEVGLLTSELQALKKEVQELKGELHSTSHTSMTHLLEELKRLKERELNYALRRHQPIPFFDSSNLMRLVGSSISTGALPSSPANTMGSPLFRPSPRLPMPSLHL